MNEWSSIRLRHVARNVVVKSSGKSEPFIGLEDVASGLGQLSTEVLPAKTAVDSLLFRPGDVLFSKLRPYLAKSVAPQVEGSCTGEMLVIRPGVSLDSRYLMYMSISAPWVNWAVTTSYGSKMPRTSWESMADFAFDLPPVGEQRRIADFLDTETARLDAVRKARSAQRARVAEHAQAILDENVETLGTRCGFLPLRRELRAIQQGSSPQCDARPADPDEQGVLKLSAVAAGVFVADENKALPAGVMGDRRYEVRQGDLLMTRANTPERVGDVAVVRQTRRDLFLPDLIYRLILEEPAGAEFVAAALRSTRLRSLVSVTARGTSQSMVKLRGEDIADLPIPAAPKADRDLAVGAIRAAETSASTLISRLAAGETLLIERRQALITAAVTGQLDVTTAGTSLTGPIR